MSDCVWIAGASTGIGAELARQLARDHGRIVAVSARSADKLAALAAESEGWSGRIHAWPVDLMQRRETADTVAQIEAAHGPIGLAILNAGTYAKDSARHFDADAFAHTLNVNVMGAVHGLEPILPRMIGRKAGHIAVVASIAGYRGLPRAISYCASKAAVIGLTESLKFDLDRHGVKIQLVNPGFVRTPLTAQNEFNMPDLMEPEDAARAFIRGLASNRFEISFPSIFPWVMRRLRKLPYGLYFPLVRRITGL